ncbi:MAG: hypothetical protein GY853_10885 [PVC group bacterium]|nr:hypothetical protein [PVC group bacterium]
MFNRKNNLFLTAAILILVSAVYSYAQPAESGNSNSKKDYFYRKILKNEVEALKIELTEKEAEYKEKFDDEYISLSDQEKITEKETEIKQLKQSAVEDKEQIDKLKSKCDSLLEKLKTQETEHADKLSQLKKQHAEEFKKSVQDPMEIIAIYDKRIAEKDKQIEKVFKRKITKEQELEVVLKEKESVDQKNKELKQQIEKQDKLYKKQIAGKEKERKRKEKKAQGKIKKLEKETTQLKTDMLTGKEKIKEQKLDLKQKEKQIIDLKSKVEFFSERALTEEKKAELRILEAESNKLEQELHKVKYDMTSMQSKYKDKLLQHKSTVLDEQEKKQTELVENKTVWEKKIEILELKYLKQIRVLGKESEKNNAHFNDQLRKLSNKLREKEKRNELLEKKLSSYRDDKKHLLTQVLANKASRAKGVLQVSSMKPNFKGKNKEKAKVHFDKAMHAISQQEYPTAKYEMEKALRLQPKNKMAAEILANINFLLESKQ